MCVCVCGWLAGCLPVCLCVFLCVHAEATEVLDLLELELIGVGNHQMWVLGTELWLSGRATDAAHC